MVRRRQFTDFQPHNGWRLRYRQLCKSVYQTGDLIWINMHTEKQMLPYTFRIPRDALWPGKKYL